MGTGPHCSVNSVNVGILLFIYCVVAFQLRRGTKPYFSTAKACGREYGF